ncbi:MAG: hypothetical protein KAG97_02470, partial [Victivallales bacterium]|nr:hypothetical protein [Victivallales bacterium]
MGFRMFSLNKKKGNDVSMNISNIKIKQSTTPCFSYNDCIAKTQIDNMPGITVGEHCMNAANVANNLLSHFS